MSEIDNDTADAIREAVAEKHRGDLEYLRVKHNIAPPEPPESPQARAEREHREQWDRAAQKPEGLVKLIADRQAVLEERGPEFLRQETVALRERLGPQEYDRLGTLARAGLPAGQKLPAAVLGDEHLLRLAAADGLMLQRREQTRPGRR